jgi:chemotaxis protein CheX
MDVRYVQPFAQAAIAVLNQLQVEGLERGELSMHTRTFTTQLITIVLPVTGEIRGEVLYGMSVATAEKLASHLLGSELLSLTEEALTALTDFGLRIAGQARSLLAANQCSCAVGEPMLVRGTRVEVSTVTPALLVPVRTSLGKLEINMALRKGSD